MSMKNSIDLIGNRTRDLPDRSAVPQPTACRRIRKLLDAGFESEKKKTYEDWVTRRLPCEVCVLHSGNGNSQSLTPAKISFSLKLPKVCHPVRLCSGKGGN